MKKILKRTLAIMLTLVMLFGIAPLSTISLTPKASAENLASYQSCLIYQVNDGYADIIGFADHGQTSLTIPEKVNGYSVRIGSLYPIAVSYTDNTQITELTDEIIDKVASENNTVKTIYVSSAAYSNNVSNISAKYAAFDYLAALENIQITGDTTEFKSIDGILFNGDKTKLIRYPRNKSGSSYSIPNGTVIGSYAFRDCNNLQSVTIPSDCDDIGMDGGAVFIDPFANCKNLTRFVTFGNKSEGYYTDENGVLYLSSYCLLVHCPMKANIKTFTLNSEVLYVALQSINNSSIETLVLDTCVQGFGQPYCNMPNVKNVKFTSNFVKACEKYWSGDVTYIYDFACSAVNSLGSKKVASVSVDTANNYIKAVNNVLYSADMKTILAYPPALEQSLFELPTSVNTMGDRAFIYFNSTGEGMSTLKHNTVMHISAEQLELFKANGLGTFSAVCANVSQQKINEANAERNRQKEGISNLIQHLTSGEELSSDEALLLFLLAYSASIYGYDDITDFITLSEQAYDFNFKVCNGHSTVETKYYSIKYNGNGGSNVPEDQIKEKDVAITLSTKIPKKDGYEFVGWSKDINASSAQYSAGAKITENENMTLYAVWKANSYTIKFYDDSTLLGSKTLKYDETGTLSYGKAPEKTGYKFIGWATIKGGPALFNNGQSVKGLSKENGSTIAYYAVWEKLNIDVLVDKSTGIVIEIPEGTYDNTVTLKIEEILSGSVFDIVDQVDGIKTKVFSIETYVNGIKTQPDGNVTVKIPVPAGFDVSKCKLYYVNTEENKMDKIAFTVKDGFIVFITNHFSDWAIVETKSEVKYVSINDIELRYKDSTKLNPVIEADSGAKYKISYKSSDSSIASVDDNGNVYGARKWSKKTSTITCTVTDEFGNSVSDTANVTVGFAWWQWIIGIVLFGFIWY